LSVAEDEKGAHMAQASSRDAAAYLLASTANALGHNIIGLWGRLTTNLLVAASAILSGFATAGVFLDAFGSAAVGWLSLAASIASMLAIICLTTLKSDAHLRLQAAYENVRGRLPASDSPELLSACIADFDEAVATAGHERAVLWGWQVGRFERKARDRILRSQRLTQELKDGIPPLPANLSAGKGEVAARLVDKGSPPERQGGPMH
jgi:hypothetical protein